MDASWEVKPYRFAVVGAGWRTLFYLRVVSALAHRFQVTGVLARSQQRAEEVHQAWGVAAIRDFGRVTVFGAARIHRPVGASSGNGRVAGAAQQCRYGGIVRDPARCRPFWPPSSDGAGSRGARVQVAEQYQYQPLHAARLSLTDGGLIGDVSMASLAVCHDYHAFSLMRRHLRLRDEAAVVRASVVRSTVETGFSITGPRQQRPERRGGEDRSHR